MQCRHKPLPACVSAAQVNLMMLLLSMQHVLNREWVQQRQTISFLVFSSTVMLLTLRADQSVFFFNNSEPFYTKNLIKFYTVVISF